MSRAELRAEIDRVLRLDSLAKSGPDRCPRGFDDGAFHEYLDELYEELKRKRP